MLIDSLRLIGYKGAAGDVDHIVHFLLNKLDASACKQVSQGCWPIIEPHRDGRQFRLRATKVFLEWKHKNLLKCVVRMGILDEKWGQGRILGELILELVTMAMRKECGGVECGLFEDVCRETDQLVQSIKTVKEQTDQFLDNHQVMDHHSTHSDHTLLNKLNNALFFEPKMPVDPKPSKIFYKESFDEHCQKIADILCKVPSVPDPHSLQVQVSALLQSARTCHDRLVQSHNQLQSPSSPTEWNIENESINLIL